MRLCWQEVMCLRHVETYFSIPVERRKIATSLTHTHGTLTCVIFYLSIVLGPPLWSIGQSSWLQTQRRYHIFSAVVGLERGPLSLVRINEVLLERKSSGSGLEN
jgi:hypothetical protein